MNNSEEILWLGYCSEYGIGVEKNENKAFIHYQKSADLNNSNGMYQVGQCYYLGIGVEKDENKAFTYFLKSAEAGNNNGIFKTAICYRYGVGVAENQDKYLEWRNKDIYVSRDFSYRDPKYGKCARCNAHNTSEAWCQTCDPDVTIQGWTSGNKDIDNCMKEFQLRINSYELMVEWIPFDRLSNIKEISESVYAATWLDGTKKIEQIKTNDNDGNYLFLKAREPSSIVALKILNDPSKEFGNYMRCKLGGIKLGVYGLTQNTVTKEYLMVFQYANNGNLQKYLKYNFRRLTWKVKLEILLDISKDLYEIHNAGIIHTNLHSGNILQDQQSYQQSYISGLRLSKKTNDDFSESGVYGVLPYVAPEILSGQRYTQAADIYSFGIIMSEMSTGQRPFDNYQFDVDLATKICNGLLPEFASGTPSCYIELAKTCMNSDPYQRPAAFDLYSKLNEWKKCMEDSDDKGKNEIKKQFLDADER